MKVNHNPVPLPAEFDYFNFTPAQVLEITGLRAAIDKAFDELKVAVAMECTKIAGLLEQKYQEALHEVESRFG